MEIIQEVALEKALNIKRETLDGKQQWNTISEVIDNKNLKKVSSGFQNNLQTLSQNTMSHTLYLLRPRKIFKT